MWGERWPHARGIEEADAGVRDVEKGRVWNGLTHRPTGSVTAIDRKGYGRQVWGDRSAVVTVLSWRWPQMSDVQRVAGSMRPAFRRGAWAGTVATTAGERCWMSPGSGCRQRRGSRTEP